MKAIPNFDNVREAGGEIVNLPAGAYVCEIKKCSEMSNRNNGGSHLEILFDIIEGDCAGWFERDYKAQDREDKFWRGIYNQNVPDESSPKYAMQCGFFKRFISLLEGSNDMYHWDWNEKGLKGLKIGVVFGEAEKRSQKGKIYLITRATDLISVEDARAGKFKMPEVKRLPGSSAAAPVDVEDDGDLPF